MNMTFVTHAQCIRAILTCGATLTPLVIGEPGTGKSSMLHALAALLPTHDPIYVDMPTRDLSDFAMKIPNRETGELENCIDATLMMRNGRPKLIMLDEYLKADRLTGKFGTRLTQERYWADVKLPEGSIVFCTSNHASDGLGDVMEAHALNRVMVLFMSKPDANETLAYGTDAGWSPVTLAWVKATPTAFQSYLDGKDADANPVIFNPRRAGQGAFLSQRSLEKADRAIIQHRHTLGHDLTRAMLEGTVGQAAAQSLISFFEYDDKATKLETIAADPMNAAISDNPSVLFVTMQNCIQKMQTQDELSACIKYFTRARHSEVMALFFTLVIRAKRTVTLAMNNADCKNFRTQNAELLVG